MLRPNKELRQAVLLALVALTASIIPNLFRDIPWERSIESALFGAMLFCWLWNVVLMLFRAGSIYHHIANILIFSCWNYLYTMSDHGINPFVSKIGFGIVLFECLCILLTPPKKE